MNAVIMDHAVVGEDAFVAACSFVKAKAEIPPKTLVAGVPAKVIRPLTAQELEWKVEGTAEYQRLAQECHKSFKECTPLTALEPGRPVRTDGYSPLADVKAAKKSG